MVEIYNDKDEKVELLEQGMCYDTGDVYRIGKNKVVEISSNTGGKREVHYERVSKQKRGHVWTRQAMIFNNHGSVEPEICDLEILKNSDVSFRVKMKRIFGKQARYD